ncbi:hypothetical protein C8Q75DRAFT_47845 [Abortiporus biennis]|nr:hypothetical protein C8Q75DRAFT_47845 [Abortiporus biennis]
MSLNCLPSDSLPADIHLDTTIGAEFIGLVISTFLTGISTLQTYNYFLGIPNNDRTPFRILVGILWILDMLLTILLTICIYTIVITDFTNPLSLVRITWSIVAFLPTSATFHFLIRCTFIYRMWRLSRNHYLAFILVTLNCIVLSVANALAHKYEQIGNFASVRSAKWLVIWVFTTLAFTDTLVAVVLCYYLWRMKSSVTRRTETQIDTLMQYSQHTGAATSLLSIAVLITYLVMPDNLIFNGLYVILPKFYHNALMATLNSRDRLRTKLSNGEEWKSIRLTAISSTSAGAREIIPSTGDVNPKVSCHNDDIDYKVAGSLA